MKAPSFIIESVYPGLTVNKALAAVLLLCLLMGCLRRDKNNLLLEAYSNNDYIKSLKILQSGADGRIDYFKINYPILFDICQKYINSRTKPPDLKELLCFYLENRKEAFEDSISGIYPNQTVGSYLARFASVELLQLIVQEKININSPDEKSRNSIFELAPVRMGVPAYSRVYGNLVVYHEEKKIRMDLLLEAGVDVTLIDEKLDTTIFHNFYWYPFEEEFAKLLDKMIEKGADLFHKSWYGSCITYMVRDTVLEQNTEAYLEYVINRGLGVTGEDLAEFNSWWLDYMNSDETAKTERARLEKIKTLLEIALHIPPESNNTGLLE